MQSAPLGDAVQRHQLTLSEAPALVLTAPVSVHSDGRTGRRVTMVGKVEYVAVAMNLEDDSVVVRGFDVPKRRLTGVLNGNDTITRLEAVAGHLQGLVVLALVAQKPSALVLLEDPLHEDVSVLCLTQHKEDAGNGWSVRKRRTCWFSPPW